MTRSRQGSPDLLLFSHARTAMRQASWAADLARWEPSPFRTTPRLTTALYERRKKRDRGGVDSPRL